MGFTSSIRSSIYLLLIFLSFSFFQTTKACHETDKAALLDFKNNIINDGPEKLLKTWNKDTDCCTQWDGVACDHSNGRVVNVTRAARYVGPNGFPTTYMIGTISTSLGDLEFLRVLDLGHLRLLGGSIPSELGNLLHLTSLFLNDNQLMGRIPASFQHLRKLEVLHLEHNVLSGRLSSLIFEHMSSLSEIDLSWNQLSGRIPSSVGNLVSLEWLHFEKNNFSGNIPSTIGSLKNLISINLSYNQISGSIPRSIGELSKLEYMFLNKNRLTGSIPSSFSKLVSLTICLL